MVLGMHLVFAYLRRSRVAPFDVGERFMRASMVNNLAGDHS